MEACIDTFSTVFGGTADYKNPSRNMSPFNHNFETACQSHLYQFAVANTPVLNNASTASSNNGHYHQSQQQLQQLQQQRHQQQQQQPTTTSSAVMFPSSNNDYSMQAMSWTDRPMSASTGNMMTCTRNDVVVAANSNKMQFSSNSSTGTSNATSTATENHGFHPFVPNDGVSAAFNLQQLHQGICSVGTLPTWQQQSFTFNDCASTNVPSQNDEGNDTRSLPMPLSMSTVPTTTSSSNTSNLLTNGHHPSSIANNPAGSSNEQFLNCTRNIQCSQAGSSDGSNNNNGQGTNAGSESLRNLGNGQFVNHSQVPNTFPTSSNGSLTLTFSASLLNGGANNANQLHRSPQHSPLPAYIPAATTGPTESSPDYVKMATTPTRHVRLRTNTKMDMDRLKAQEEDKRERELQKQQRAIRESKAVPVSVPPAVNVVVPSQVLQVTSALENPTPFHVEQKRKFNIKQYCAGITNSLPDVQGAVSSLNGTTNGSATLQPPAKHNRLQHLITNGAVSSAPPNYSTTPAPVSPVPVLDPAAASSPGPSQRSSVATSVNDEFEDSILDLLLTDEKTGDQVASLPQTGFNQVNDVLESSSSCPADSTKDVLCFDDPVKVTKDRIKKDNHNKIERKRRFHINDMITEQGKLLPKANERHHEKIGEVKQNKGSILKASVDYTKVLKQDNEFLHQKLAKAEEERKQLLLRLQRVEQLCKQSGVQIPEDIMTWKTASTSEDITTLLTTPEVRIKQEPIAYPVEDFERNICDMMDEDRSIVTGTSDPMFGQPVEVEDGFHHPEGMDFND